jgi:hypothetical protein
MAQRNFLKQLPVINQTQTLQKFFDATINQVFQPGQLQNVNAYIGRKPSYYNPATDFYKPEYNAERAFYQLEAAMVSDDSNGNVQDFLYYTDLVNNLRYQGALTNNHQRLFDTDYYSWCPPINLDKLQNYQNYYWLPDGPPIMTMTIPSNTYTGDGTTTTFAAPTSLPNSIVDVVVKDNGVGTTAFTYNSSTNEVTFTTAPAVGDQIEIWTNGNFKQNINGQATYQFPSSVTAYAIEEMSVTADAEEDIPWATDYASNQDTLVAAGEATTTTSQWALNDYMTWEIEEVVDTTTELYFFPTVTVEPAPALLRGMRVEVVDDTWDSNWDVMSWDNDPWECQLADIVELEQVNDVMVIDLVNQSGKMIRRADPQFWTIERNAIDQNPWSLTNHWYHSSLIFYNSDTYPINKANRPIIEFDNNLKLYNYGARRLDPVDYVYDASASGVALFNTVTEQKPTAIVGEAWGTAMLNSEVLEPGQRILALNSLDPTVSNNIYVVGVDSNNNITLTAQAAPVLYDMVSADDTPTIEDIQNASIQYWDLFQWDQNSLWDYVIPQEFWFDGTTWVVAQAYSDNAPLFDLFDNSGNSFSNTAAYPSTSFTGSNIFAYEQDTTGTTSVDSVLNIAPVFNTYGSFEFTNNINTDVITSSSGTYGGLKYFAYITLDSNDNTELNYYSNWRYAGDTTQPIDPTTGFYTIPQNLQANPDNDDITTISLNDWYPQFQQIITANDWLYPSEYRTVDVGTNIVQNRGTLLKTMLLSANKNLDMMKTFLYVEREYARYRSKLVQYLTNLYTSSAIVNVESALSTALNYLKVTKTSAFAFFNNGMGGGNYYIPASGAYLGLTPLWTPEFILQTVGSNTYVLLRGHDGSLLPGFTTAASTNVQLSSSGLVVNGVTQAFDIRDQIMLTYEQQLYASCDSSLQAQLRPQFDLKQYQPGKFRTTEYAVSEFVQVATPMFDRWTAQGQKDFRTNKNFDENNVWTWNFSWKLDADGQALPGHWRGIYRYFYDTERPDTHPWEMLGFTTQPTWWAANYSWTNPTQRAAMIAAIVAGNVAEPGLTPVINPVFARPTFNKYIPVDTNGNLLDPFAAGITTDDGDPENYAADWVFGDCAPVEYSWWTSEYASFILSEISYLLKPVRFVETGWQTPDNENTFPTTADQWISSSYGRRMHFSEYTVHNEVVNNSAVAVIGLQQWISDYVTSLGQNITSAFGSHVRGLGVQLANKVGGFTDSTTVQASTESQGVLPSDATDVILYNSPSINEVFYSGVIVKWNGTGWAVLGYDVLTPSFNILPVNTTGQKVTISLGTTPAPTSAWRSNTFYQTGVLVSYQNGIYECLTSHTSGSTFEQQYWSLQAQATAVPPSLLYYTTAQKNAAAQVVPYGTVFYKAQDVANFLAGYELYLKSQGWVFNSFDTTLNAANDFRLATRQFLNWIQVSWAPGMFLTLSPLSDAVTFKTSHGAIQPVEQVINGVYSILDRGGAYVDIKSTKVNRLNGEITVSATGTGIFGLRLCVAEVEHCLIFENTTKFGDVIYEPLFNLRQDRILMDYNVSTNWTGTLNAPGFLITDNLMIPSFDRSVEDVRNMFSIEQPVYSIMRDYARHQIGYQERSYLEDIFPNELNQFEFYQGMIQQKGSSSVLNKLLRNTVLTQTTNLEFLEEWAFRVGNYGAMSQEVLFEFVITPDNIKQEPQRIAFDKGADGLTPAELTALQNVDSLLMTLYSNSTNYDSRWVTPPKKNRVFAELADYTRHGTDLATAGYARIGEADVMACNLAAFNADVEAETTKIKAGQRLWVYDNGNDSWDMLRAVEDTASTADPINYVSTIQGSTSGLEVQLLYPTTIQAGEYIYLASPVGTTPDIGGVYEVLQVLSDGVTVIIDTSVDATITFTPVVNDDGSISPDPSAPAILRMFSLRYYEGNGATLSSIFGTTTVAQRTGPTAMPVFTVSALPQVLPASLSPYTSFLNDGEIVYVDVGYVLSTQHNYPATQKRWAAYTWSVSGNQFTMFRSQAPRIHRERIDSVQIFDTTTSIDSSSNQMQANPLLYPDVMSFDPVQGLIPGAAMREVWYKQEYDPALYNYGAGVADTGLEWDATQVGRIWWDLRTAKFLLAETNDLSKLDSADYQTEINYRTNNWGSLAPNSEIDFYEWTESTVTPADWHTNYVAGTDPTTYDGDVYNSANPSWVEKQVWDTTTSQFVTMYYFWVNNRQTTPNVSFRNISAASAAQIVTDPTSNGISWMAPVAGNSLIVRSISQYLTPTSSLQVRLRKNDAQVGKHSQWDLLRPGDDLSLPSNEMFTGMSWSLAGYDPFGNSIPNPNLYSTAQTGNDLQAGQSWFSSSTNARKSLVEFLNDLFATILLSDDRPYALPVLQVTESSNQYLQWSQTTGSAYIAPVPSTALWTGQYATLQDYRNAIAAGTASDQALVYNFGIDSPFWSVMSSDSNGDLNIATLWDQEVASLTELNALTNVAEGTTVLVTANAATANMWTVWKYTNGAFTLLTTQRYNTNDIISVVDWYASGYDATMVPSTVFATQAARDTALGTNPTIQYVLVSDDGQGRWMWQAYSDGAWNVVAKENGTIQFNDNIWSNTGGILNVTGSLPSNFASLVANRDMAWELNLVLNALRDSVLLGSEMNDLFFSMVNYVHTEQDFVDWCFKTSFMYIQGFNANLIASPIASVDYTTDLLDYINEVKPYHVQIRNFISKYGINDTANVHATDFDKPVYFDPNLQVYRVLDPTNAADVVILQTGIWADWYNNWQAGNNQVRSIKATLTFDRVSAKSNIGWDESPFDVYGFDFDTDQDDGALVRLSEYWSGNVQSSKELAAIMSGVFFNGPVVRGGHFTAPEFLLSDITFAQNSAGVLVATNAPSYVYFAQKYDAGTHKLSSDWDTPLTLWDDDNDINGTNEDIWDQITYVTWEEFVNQDWNQLNYTGSTPKVWDAYEFDFVATTPEFDYTAGNRLEVFKNGARLSLINQDYIVVQDATVANTWKVYISTDVLKANDTLVILLVAGDTPTAVFTGGNMSNPTNAFTAVMAGPGLADPYHQADHPEELVDVNVVAGVRIRINQRWLPGSVQMDNFTINGEVSATKQLPIPAQSKQAIALYDNGARVAQNLVSFDAQSSSVTYLGTDLNSSLNAVVWGYGGENQIAGQSYFNGDGSTTTFTMKVAATYPSDLFVTVNGIMTTAFTVNGTALTFATAPASGNFIKVMNMPSVVTASVASSGFNIVNVTEYNIVDADLQTISTALGITGSLDPVTTIVEVDGLRVMSAGIYEAFITPDAPYIDLGYDANINNLNATFNGQPIVLGTNVEYTTTIPAATRSVSLGANWAASDLVVTSGGAPMVIGTIVGTAPGYSLTNLNPAQPELNSSILVDWDEDLWDNISLWDDPTLYQKYVVSPANAQLVAYQGYLFSFSPMASDLLVNIEFGDTIPNTLTGYTWTPTNADALLMGDQIYVLGGVSGDLVITDASQSQFSYDQSALTQFPGATRMTVTTFTNVDDMDMHTVTYDHITGDNWFPIPGAYPNVASLWVTLNGVKLRYGIDFYVNAADNGFDVPAWDEDARDELSSFGPGSLAVRMNEEAGVYANPGDHVVITVFGATQATAPQETIMFLDPLRDYGFADRTSTITNANKFTLVNAIDQTDEIVVLSQVESDGLPALTQFKTQRTQYNPGLMWIGKELISFLSASVDTTANTITLHNVTRGWRGSAILPHNAGAHVTSVSSAVVDGNVVTPNNTGDIMSVETA